MVNVRCSVTWLHVANTSTVSAIGSAGAVTVATLPFTVTDSALSVYNCADAQSDPVAVAVNVVPGGPDVWDRDSVGGS